MDVGFEGRRAGSARGGRVEVLVRSAARHTALRVESAAALIAHADRHLRLPRYATAKERRKLEQLDLDFLWACAREARGVGDVDGHRWQRDRGFVGSGREAVGA